MTRTGGTRSQRVARYGKPGLFVLALALLPILLRSPYWISTLIFVGLFTIITVGLCLLLGHAGQLSLGHNAFYGLGAYASAITTTRYGLSPWLGIALSMALTGALAAVLAKPIFRLRGQFLAMATLGLGIIFSILFSEATNLTGGPSGLAGLPYLSVGAFVFDRDIEYYYLVWGVAALALLVSSNLVNSRFGRALRAIGDSEIAAQTMSIDTAQLKAQIFVLSCIYAGLAGSLYAHYVTFVNPSPFELDTSLMLLVMVAIGGMGSIWGALLGAAVVTFLTEFLRSLVPRLSNHATGEYQIIVFGILLIVIMSWMPEGVAPRLARLYLQAKVRATSSWMSPGGRSLPSWLRRAVGIGRQGESP